MLRFFRFGIPLAGLGLWVFWYALVHSLACAFVVNDSGNGCKVNMPWELNVTSEDFMILIVIPGVAFLVLTGVTLLITSAIAKR